MYITAHNIVPYLIERGTVTAARVVHHNCRVENSSSRNRCFRIVFDSPPGVFVKQMPINETGASNFLHIEAECLKLFQHDSFRQSVGQHTPRVHSFDATRHILAVELLQDSQSVRVHGQTHPEQREMVAGLMGSSLAKFHLPAVTAALDDLPPAAQYRVPSILREHSALLGSHDTAGIGEKVRQFPEFSGLLQSLAEHWQCDGLMHGDIRWDNLLLSTNDPERLWIIDWELAGRGDTAWDVAGIVQAYLIDWIAEYFTLEQLQQYIATFLQGYLSVRPVPNTTNFILKVVNYAGGRLVQSALEHHPTGYSLTHLGRQMLQLSWNTLRDPQAVIDELLQLPRMEAAHA